MITYVAGDLFTSPAHVLVNTVNTVGVMGKGIAKEFKAIFPEMYKEYKTHCDRDELAPGSLYLYRTPHKWILNFPTKRHWRQRSRLDDIEAGLKTFVDCFNEEQLLSVAFPQLGCGNGQLDWEREVRPLMEQYLAPLPIEVYIHIYTGETLAPKDDTWYERTRDWLQSEPEARSASDVWSDILARVAAHHASAAWEVVPPADTVAASLRFTSGSGNDAITYDQFFDLWLQLSAFGFLSVEDAASTTTTVPTPFVDLLYTLPYVRAVRFASLISSKNEHAGPIDARLASHAASGVQLGPRACESLAKSTQIELATV